MYIIPLLNNLEATRERIAKLEDLIRDAAPLAWVFKGADCADDAKAWEIKAIAALEDGK